MENIILYNTEDGKASVKLYAENNTVWLTQAQMAELFDKNISTISKYSLQGTTQGNGLTGADMPVRFSM